ncbi:hypothetical protein F5882DRAFT_259312, partial [Hyaloscypha sp. PMI_1271]
DTLNCELVRVLMGSAPTYYALSYAWGSAEAYENILVNNTHLPRTRSYIWVDAICINQHNLSERGAQVLLMTKIYSDATMVAIWLG